MPIPRDATEVLLECPTCFAAIDHCHMCLCHAINHMASKDTWPNKGNEWLSSDEVDDYQTPG